MPTATKITYDDQGNVLSVSEIDAKQDRRESIISQLADLDRVTMHRAMELWAKQNGDSFVKAKIAEKEELRAELVSLE